MEEQFILNVNDGATFIDKQVKGWRSRKGSFFGIGPDAERLARYDGATHRQCEAPGCKNIIPNNGGWLWCYDCRSAQKIIDYNELPDEPWNADEPCYSFALDEYYWDEDEIADDADEHGGLSALMLQKCEPVFATELDPMDIYHSDLPDDGDAPNEIKEAFEELNAKIRTCKTPLSWTPRRVKAIIELEDENGNLQSNKTS